MQFTALLAAAAAFAVAQAVQFTNPSFNGVTAGSAFNISWTGASGPVTLTLKDGPSTALKTVSTIASGLTGSSYTWSVPATLPANTYAIQIDDSTGVPNYSTQFQLIGGVTTSSSSGSSTAAASSSSSIVTTTAKGNLTLTSTRSGSTSSSTSGSKASSSGSSGSKTTAAAGSSSPTSAPGSAAGISSPLGFVFLAFAAFLTLN